MILVDEAKKFLSKYTLSINETTHKLQGVHPLKGKRVILCSATYSRTFDKIITEVLGFPRESFIRFEDNYEIIHGKPAKHNIQY